jgi:Sushi repeat (SCR repeat)
MIITCCYNLAVGNAWWEDGTEKFRNAVSYEGTKFNEFNYDFCSSSVEMGRIYDIFDEVTRTVKDLKNCPYMETKYFYSFQIQKERRLRSIRLRTTFDNRNRLEAAVFTFQGRKNNKFKWENLNISRSNEELDSSLVVVLTIHSNSYHFKNFILTSNDWFRICEIVLFAYHDECGHPEVPLHCHVQFETDYTRATYRCDEGYKLDSNYSIRHCIQGQWNGSQPICMKLI